jgi:hypothetical protein
MVEERSCRGEARPTRTGGAVGSDPAGISSEKGSENLPRRKPKDSSGRFVR